MRLDGFLGALGQALTGSAKDYELAQERKWRYDNLREQQEGRRSLAEQTSQDRQDATDQRREAAAAAVAQRKAEADARDADRKNQDNETIAHTLLANGNIGLVKRNGTIVDSGQKGMPPGAADARRDARQDESQRLLNLRAATDATQSARREFGGVMARRPKLSQFKDPTGVRPDTAAFNENIGNWRADSTDAAGNVKTRQSQEDALRSLGMTPAPQAPTAPAGKVLTKAQYDKVRAAGKTDAQIRAEGYVIPK